MIDNILKLREVQLELLQEFADVCDRHGLKWYAFFGTLLGVVRHDGFLPLDDDVDVAMPICDYRELCMHGEWFDSEKFALQTPLDPGMPNFAKLRRNGTTAFKAELRDELKMGGHHGICIDIIPLADLPGMDAYHTPSVGNHDKKTAVYLKGWFEPAGTGVFEGLDVRIPALPRKVLTETYKDWAWPHGARQSYPGHWFFDTDRGYEHYVRRYTGMLDGIDGKKIFLFGAADSLRIWLDRFDRRNQVVCTFDNDPGKWGKMAYGVEVRDPSELPDLLDDSGRVIIVSIWHQEIGRQLEKMGISDYYVYLDDYYDEKIGKPVVRREDADKPDIPRWDGDF